MPANPPQHDEYDENALLSLLGRLYPSWKITLVVDAQGRKSWSVNRITPLTERQRAAGLVDSFTQGDLRRVADQLGQQQAIRDRNRL